jgi:hypothetical protein
MRILELASNSMSSQGIHDTADCCPRYKLFGGQEKKGEDLREQLGSMRKALGESLPLKGKKPAPIRLPA